MGIIAIIIIVIIYKVFYLLNDERMEAWVKYGGCIGTKWLFDYKV